MSNCYKRPLQALLAYVGEVAATRNICLETREVNSASNDEQTVFCVNFDGITLLGAEIPPPSVQDDDQTVVRSVIESAADILLGLSPKEAVDFVIVFIAPPGADEQGDWMVLAEKLECSDALCRKLVWLPPAKPESWHRSSQECFERTVFSRPWGVRSSTTGELHDPLQVIQASYALWMPLLEGEGNDYELVRQLIDIETVEARKVEGNVSSTH